MSTTPGARRGNVLEVTRRRGRPKLTKKSIAELEMKIARNVLEEERRVGEVEWGSEMVGDVGESEEEPCESKDDGGYATEEDSDDRPKPVGSPIGSHDKGGELYVAFEWDGNTYELEDAVMVTPEAGEERPRVAIIKTIWQAANGEMFATLRWLYRPEEVNMKDDPRWLSNDYDPRELLFTDHKEEVPAVMIMYKCVVHFLPSHKQLPNRRVHPGFVVQHFYDHLKQRVFKITQKAHWKGSLRKEICSRMRETELRIGYVPDVGIGDTAAYPKGFKNNKPFLGENTATSNIGEDKLYPDKQGLERPDEQLSTQRRKIKTPTSHVKSPYIKLLSLYGALRDDTRRDIWLERLLEAIHSQWNCISSRHDDRVISEYVGIHLKWPDCVIGPIFSLEDEADIMYEGDTQKYNQKMRQLVFNLKNNGVLAKRFVTQELKPSILLNMSPDELKAGLTAAELPRTDSDGKQEIQMVDAHCKRCSEKKARLLDVIQAGSKQRYQLQCSECGNTWFTSRNEIS